MVDKILALKEMYVAEIEKLQVKIEVLNDLVDLFADEPTVEERIEEVVEPDGVVDGEIEETNELAEL